MFHVSLLSLSLGLFVATFYHFFVHDTEGFIGNALRNYMPIRKLFDMDDKTFGYCVVSGFMQVMGILQMPDFLGPSFTPFGTAILTPFFDPSTWTLGKYEGAYAEQQKEKAEAQKIKTRSFDASANTGEGDNAPMSKSKKRRKNRNKKKTS